MTYAEMRREIHGSDGLVVLAEDGRTTIEVFDDVRDREVVFRAQPDIQAIVHFNGLRKKIDQERFFAILRRIDPVLLMTVRSIHFLYSRWDFQKLDERLPNNTLDLHEGEAVGMFDFFDTAVILDVREMIRTVRNDFIWDWEIEDAINTGIWTTLLHELRHAHHANPIFENEFEGLDVEEDAEAFARRTFEDVVMAAGGWRVLPLKALGIHAGPWVAAQA